MVITLEIIGSALELLGKVVLAVAVLMVHRKMIRENGIDKNVIDEIHHEELVTMFAIGLMVVGFVVRHL